MLSILFAVLAAASNVIMDISSEDGFKNNFWNKTKSWKNKWKINSGGRRVKETKKRWYYLWKFTPEYQEKFPLSSTVLVSLTDGWHLAQAAMLFCFFAGTVLFQTITGNLILDFIILRIAFGLGFEPLYRFLKKKKK